MLDIRTSFATPGNQCTRLVADVIPNKRWVGKVRSRQELTRKLIVP